MYCVFSIKELHFSSHFSINFLWYLFSRGDILNSVASQIQAEQIISLQLAWGPVWHLWAAPPTI